MRYHAEVLSSGVTQGPWMFVLDTVEESQASTSSDWKKAHARAIATLEELSTTISQTHEKDIIEAQILMLQDPTWLSRVEELSRTFDPKTAIWQSAEEFASSLDQIADPYLQQRAQDIRDVAVLLDPKPHKPSDRKHRAADNRCHRQDHSARRFKLGTSSCSRHHCRRGKCSHACIIDCPKYGDPRG